MPSLVCIVVGIVAGIAGGFFGVGGGVIIVPFLILALRFEQHRAQGTSLLALALPVAGVGAYNYWVEGKTNVAVGLCIAAGIALGSFFGSRIALGVSASTMRKAFCVFLTVIAAYLFFKNDLLHLQSTDLSGDLPAWAYPVSVLAGLLAGLTGGLFGVGGGVIAVPFTVLAFGFPQHLAQGTSLLALTLPVAAFGAYNYHRKGNVDVRAGICIALGIVGGGYLGSKFALGLEPVTMQRAFSVFVVTMAAYLFFKKQPKSPLPV
ncbi:MAG: sulfite exporter TauE/SafE family protein [Fimbriimonadaceae bacterium]